MNPKALVTVRVIVRDGRRAAASEKQDEWLDAVIRGVNTQNRVHTYDFRSNEPEQIELRKRFRAVKVFYERKRGEWREFRNEPRYKGFERLSLVRLGQIVSATSDNKGNGVLLVKRGAEEIFSDRHYHELFPAKRNVGRRFERMYLAYRIFRLADRFGYKNGKERRRQQHGFWHTVFLLYRGLTSIPRFFSRVNVTRLCEAFDELEGQGMRGRRARATVVRVRKAVWAAWRKARRADVEKWTANNFFKSRYGSRRVLSLAFPKVRQSLRDLSKAVLSG